ncbi:ALP1-like protein [Tanacetum coccineum]|uniref:ALP1-like protein n=1 Tax=Tanacetum coccineum TaxID=301880 RepID=A0ABQ5FPX2_9ASTR
MLEVVASQDLWIWHAFFEVAGANNDIYVLDNSPLFDDRLDDKAPVAPYVVNGVGFEKGYYLVDGIYPQWATFVKSFMVANDAKHAYFKKNQESARKDVEHVDEVKKISTLIFVTNFPDQFYAKDLWKVCNQYGNVVDAFIPNRRSKSVGYKGIHGEDGKLGKNVNHSHPSIWLDIVHEMEQLKNHATDLLGFIHKKMGNGADTSFWEDVWRGDVKMSHDNVGYSLRRIPKGGIEHVQFLKFLASMEDVALVDMRDRWVLSLEGSGEFSVASVEG